MPPKRPKRPQRGDNSKPATSTRKGSGKRGGGYKRSSGSSSSGNSVRGHISVTPQNLLILETKKENYPLMPSRNLPVIPGDVVLARLNRGAKAVSAIPFKLIRDGESTLCGRLSNLQDQKPENALVDFGYWKLPALELPPEFTPTSSSRIVDVHVGRDSNHRLRIRSVVQHSTTTQEEEIYAWTIIRFGLRDSFSPEVLAEAQKHDRDFVLEAINKRTGSNDLRNIAFVTIDGEDAKDFDDAVFCRSTPDGFELFVAVADVAHFVHIDSALDQEAQRRASSVYFPGKVLPMLPASLSDDLCSLVPKKPRLAMVCHMRLDQKGYCQSYRFIEAVIKSQARLSYSQVNRWRAGKHFPDQHRFTEEIKRSLHSLFDLYEVVKKQPRKRLNIEIPGSNFKLDASNRPIKLVRTHRGDSERMIEEMMILANVASALAISEHRQHPGLYRIHPEPRAEFINDIYEVVKSNFPESRLSRTPEIFNQCLRIFTSTNGEFWPLFLVRHLSLAAYSPQHKAHFGLDLPSYAHFTSPIRRYADLVNHRILKRIILSQQPLYQAPALGELSTVINAQIRCNDKAMYHLSDCMKLILCQKLIGKKMDGFIDKLTPFGVFLYLPDVALGAFIHQSTMRDYYYDFKASCFVRRRGSGSATLICGSPVQVKLLSIDLDKQFLDVIYVSSPKTKL